MKYPILAALLLTCAQPALANDAALRFGLRENVQQISLSPDGAHVAVIEPKGARGTSVVVVDIRTGAQTTAISSSGAPDRLGSCHWSSERRLICMVYMILPSNGDRLGFTRMIAVDLDGKNLKLLSARDSSNALGVTYGGGTVIDYLAEDASGSVLMTRDFVPEGTTGTHLASSRTGLGVERVDTVTLKRSIVEPPRLGAIEYISDGHGTVRIMGIRGTDGSGYDKNVIKYLYRRSGSRDWAELSSVSLAGGVASGFDPHAVGRDRNVAYGFDSVDGHVALFSVALDGTGKRERVLARNDVDVDSLIRVGRQKRVVGASFATDKRVTEFFDPTLKKLAASFAKALPGLPLVSFVDASADENTLLLFAGSDLDPGHYYLFDKTTRKLDEVTPVRPQLADLKLAAVKPVSYPAADGTMIPAYLTLPPGSDGKNLPAIVMPHGGPAARDEWGFDWLAQYFANRGYAVLQPNFRGSSGYGAAWFAQNGFRSWRIAVGDVDDGGRWLVKSGIADAGKLAIVGWSYGGYAALQSAVVEPGLFKAVVAVAPVTDFETLRQEHANFTDYVAVDSQIGHGPHIRAGSPAQNAGAVAVPVLMFHGDRDQNVGIGESRMMAARLKGAGKAVELVEFHDLDHQLDDSTARMTMLEKADTFLRASMGMAPAQ